MYHPDVVSIETNRFCNGNCRVCIRRYITRPIGRMSLSTFQKIIDQLPEGQWIVPSAWNEPFCQDDIWDYLDYCKNMKLMMYTNGSLLTDGDIEMINDSPQIKRFFVSFNGGTKEDYEKSMGLEFDEVYPKVIRLIQSKRREDLEINITAWFTENTQENIHKLYALFPGASNITYHKYFNVRGLLNGTNKICNPSNLGCARPFFYLSVLYNGDVNISCNDINGEEVYGNIEKTPLLDIWNSEGFNETRRLHMTGRIKEIGCCSTCDEPCRSQNLYEFYSKLWLELL
jgi:hypothetical protein